MQKLRRFWGVKETSPVPHRHVVPLTADAGSNQDVDDMPVIDVRAHSKDLQDSPASSATCLDVNDGGQPLSSSTSKDSSLPTHQNLRSEKKRERPAMKRRTSIEQPVSGRESAVSRRSNSVTMRSRSGTVWSSDDKFFPRAKPPPPLMIKRKGNTPTSSPSSPSPTKQHRPSTSHQTTSHRKLSKQPQRDTPPSISAAPPPRRPSTAHSYSVQESSARARLKKAHRLSNSHGDVPMGGIPPVSTWHDRRLSIMSMGSDMSDNSFTPDTFASAWKWSPPESWAGPSGTVTSVDHDDGKQISQTDDKPTRIKSAKGSLHGHVHSRPDRPLQTMWRPLTEIEAADEVSVSEEDVVIKIQAAETDEWHESALADVIPHLRALKAK